MPYLFFMVLPMMMWDTLMGPPAREASRGEAARKEAAREEAAREPWGRLTP